MYQYDPEQAPDPAAWLALDEQVRIDLVAAYHRRERIKVPNIQAHAIIHAIVENQIAEAHAPVIRAMSRLVAEGLTRHDALHAVGFVLAGQLFELLRNGKAEGDPMVSYDAAIERLTADAWRRG